MSRRFGRNQRRAARQALAIGQQQLEHLQSALTMNRGLLADQGRRLQELKDEMDDARRIAGRMSVLFPATRMSVHGKPRNHIELINPSSMPTLREMMADDFNMPLSRTLSQTRLPVMLSSLSRDALMDAVHVRVHFGDGAWGYAVDRESIQYVPNDVLERRIASELGQMIAGELQSAPSHRQGDRAR